MLLQRSASALIATALATALACSGDDGDVGESEGGSEGESAGESAGETGDASIQALCVDTINEYRATLGLPAYERWSL